MAEPVSTPHHPNLDVALAAAAAGFPVGPCDPASKVPLIPKSLQPKNGVPWSKIVPPWLHRDGEHGGHLRSSCRPNVVRSYWRMHPDALPLIVIPPGKVVVDVDDVDHFPKRLLAGLRKAAALIVRTPGGGQHLWFKTFPGARQGRLSAAAESPERKGWNLHVGDLKVTAAGYVFPPGAARKDGKTYAAERGALDTELTEIPADLLAALRRLRDRSPKRGGKGATITPDELAEMPDGGGRNDAFNASVFVEAKAGVLTPGREREWRRKAAESGLSESEIDKTFRSARDGGRRKAADDPKPPAAKPVPSAVESEADLARAWLDGPAAADFAWRHGWGWMCWTDIGWRLRAVHAVIRPLMDFGRATWTGGKYPWRTGGKKSTASGAEVYLREACEREGWDESKTLLGLADRKVVDLQTGAVREQTRDDLVTRCAAGCPDGDWTETPWGAFLAEALPDGTMDWVQRLFGYAATGFTNERILLFIHGPSTTGKGTFSTAIADALGDYTRRIDPDDFMRKAHAEHPTWLADLAGARLVIGDELERGRRWNSARVKRFVGGVGDRARRMNQDFFEFIPEAQLVFAANYAPRVTARDSGLVSRLRVLRFDHRPDEPDKGLQAKLKTEHVLAWIIEGSRLYFEHGLGDAPAAVLEASAEYHRNADPISQFLDESYPAGGTFPVGAVHDAYTTWAANEGIGHPLAKRALSDTLVDNYGAVRGRSNDARLITIPPAGVTQ